MTVMLKLAAGAVLVYGALIALVWGLQERLIFMPEPLPAAHRFDFGADVHEAWIDVSGARLNTLHLKLPAPDGIVFYLHGNAGNLQSWFVNADFYRKANLDLFMLDYRGYGKSSGRIDSEAQLRADARAAWDAVAPGYAGKRRIVFGRSLGTGLAAKLAADVQPELTVLVSPYESMAALAAEHYRWVPGIVLRYPMRTDQWLAKVQGPVLLVHGEHDEVIGMQHSERLVKLAGHATLLRVPGAGHNDLQVNATYLDGVRAALTAAR
jgi:pimeloyl-ACP methyl ester carboxylesterase